MSGAKTHCRSFGIENSIGRGAFLKGRSSTVRSCGLLRRENVRPCMCHLHLKLCTPLRRAIFLSWTELLGILLSGVHEKLECHTCSDTTDKRCKLKWRCKIWFDLEYQRKCFDTLIQHIAAICWYHRLYILIYHIKYDYKRDSINRYLVSIQLSILVIRFQYLLR